MIQKKPDAIQMSFDALPELSFSGKSENVNLTVPTETPGNLENQVVHATDADSSINGIIVSDNGAKEKAKSKGAKKNKKGESKNGGKAACYSVSPSQHFLLHVLPDVFARLASELARYFLIPVDVVAVLMLAILACVFQGRCSIATMPGWREKLSLYVLCVFPPAFPSEMLLSALMRPIETYQAELLATEKRIKTELTAEKQRMMLKIRKAAERSIHRGPDQEEHTKEHNDLVAQLAALEVPRDSSRIIFTDVMSAAKQLTLNNAGYGAVVDFESGTPIVETKGNHKLISFLSGLYSGFSKPLNTRSEAGTAKSEKGVTLLLGGNWRFAYDLLRMESRLSNLGSKFLHLSCDYDSGALPSSPSETLQQHMIEYERGVLEWLRSDKVVELRLSHEAEAKLNAFRAGVSDYLASTSPRIALWGANLPLSALKSAGLLHCARNFGKGTPLSGKIMAYAIEIAEYLLWQAIAAYGRSAQALQLSNVDYLIMRLAYMSHEGLTVKLLLDAVWRRIRTVAELHAVLKVLSDRGIIEPVVKVKTAGQPTEPITVHREELHKAALELYTEQLYAF